MQKLRDVLGTRFITNGNASALHRIITSDLNEVFDLAGCIISKPIAECVEKYPLQFIDSQDAYRSYILEANKRAYHLRSTVSEVMLPRRGGLEVVPYLQSLNNTDIYGITDVQQFPLAAIVYIMAPAKQLSFGYLTQKFGAYLSNYLYQRDVDQVMKYLGSTDSFFVYHSKYLEPATISHFNDLSIETSAGTFDPMDLFSDVVLLPACIGSERINNNPLYSGFWESILTEVYAPENRDVSLYDLLQRK